MSLVYALHGFQSFASPNLSRLHSLIKEARRPCNGFLGISSSVVS